MAAPPTLPEANPGPEADRMLRAGLQAFFRLAEGWHLTGEAQRTLLGSPSRATLHRWRTSPPRGPAPDLLERLSYLLGIWKALRILIPEDRQALAWVHRPNAHPLFGGRPPLAHMLQGRIMDLADVRRHLDAARGVW